MVRYSTGILCLIAAGVAFQLELPVGTLDYTLTGCGDYHRFAAGRPLTIGRPGWPELPVVVYNYCLMPGQRLKSVRVLSAQWSLAASDLLLYPEQQARPIGEPPVFTAPDTQAYRTAEAYPADIVVNKVTGNLRGYPVVQLAIAPFRYFPAARRLERLTALALAIETEPGAMGFAPRRQSPASRAGFARLVKAIAVNAAPEPPVILEANPADATPTELPSLLGPPVDMIIITTDHLAAAYEGFVRLKKLSGLNTIVRSMSWIRSHYTGVDDADRTRGFIREAVLKWGVSYVLLGGDVPHVPTRTVWFAPLLGPYTMDMSTDVYFSDLDRESDNRDISWNFDGDDKFGELEDSVDFFPDVLIGRLPAASPEQVTNYCDKLRRYLAADTGYIQPPWTTRALFVSSDFYIPNDALNMANRLRLHVPGWFSTKNINERPLADTKSEIYNGYGLITLLGHGDINIARVRSGPREYATNFFLDTLRNAVCPLMVVITCYCGPFEVDCFGEHWVTGRSSGGGIGFIGPSSSSSAFDHEGFVQVLYDYLYSDTLGDNTLGGALAFSKVPFISSAQWYNWKRVFEFSLNLLGDPSVSLWDTVPGRFGKVTTPMRTLRVGSDTIDINVEPGLDFTAVFYKEHEVFFTDSGTGGRLRVPVETRSSGYLKYAVSRRNYVTVTDSIPVRASGPYVIFTSRRIVDSLDNANGIANPGEDLFLYVTLENPGGETAQDIRAQIFCADTGVAVMQDTASYPDLAPGISGENSAPFRLRTADYVPDEYTLDIRIGVSFTGGSNEDTFQLSIAAPRLALHTQTYLLANDTLEIESVLENCGTAAADSVTAMIAACSDTLFLIDSVCSFDSLLPGEIKSSPHGRFKAYLTAGGALEYYFYIYGRGALVSSRKITLATPDAPGQIRAQGYPDGVTISWETVAGALGYRIYRAAKKSGPYTFLRNPLAPVSVYTDYAAAGRNRRYYCLRSVDSSYNESGSSDTAETCLNPPLKTGWPKPVFGYIFSSPNFADLDPDYEGLEIVVGARDGGLYAWHCDGSPVGNAASFTDGRICRVAGEIWSSPAIGDVDQDGTLEIIFGVRTHPNNLWVVDARGRSLAHWPRTLAASVISSPVLADIDSDGDLEIFIGTEGGGIYAFHHSGQGVYTPDGKFKQLSGGSVGTMAIGDIDCDSRPEIVIAGGSHSDSLFVFDADGNPLPPFPVSVRPYMNYSVVLGDVCGDPRLEICVFTDSTECVNLIGADGTILWQRAIPWLGDVEASPVIADIDGDGNPEIVCGNNGSLVILDSLGNDVPGFPASENHNCKLPIVADVDGDGQMDIIAGSSAWAIYANDNRGGVVPGFPVNIGSNTDPSPAVYDIDNDGLLELMAGNNSNKFYVFETRGTTAEWCKFRYDTYNTGTYRSGINGVKSGDRVSGLKNTRPAMAVGKTLFGAQLVINVDYDRCPDGFLKIYDAAGRAIRQWRLAANEMTGPVIWDGTDANNRRAPAGVYFVRLEADDLRITEKVIFIK